MIEKQNPRSIAADILYEIEKNNAYSNLLLRHRLQPMADRRDRAFATELVYGVLQYQRYLDYVIDAFSKRKTNKMTVPVLVVLRLGVYQLTKMDRVPQSAAVNESVNLAKQMAGRGSASFVNGVLRSVCRSYDSIAWPKDPLNCLSVKESLPFWMAGLFYKRIGRECDALFPAFNRVPDLILRVNSLRTSRAELIETLSKESIEAQESILAPDALVCKGFSVGESPAYKEGLFSVQDTAAQLSVCVLDPKPGDSVLDMCAAPGGKTCYIAEKMQNEGMVEAWDIYDHKIRLIDEQAKRLGISIIRAKVADATEQASAKLFDKILVDAPCSGLGILARKPEIKWHRTKEEIGNFASLQYTILCRAATLLKKGGVLVYSTCTLTQEENEAVVEHFLKENSSFAPVRISPYFNKTMAADVLGNYITLWPHRHLTDGFFIAKFQKTGD